MISPDIACLVHRLRQYAAPLGPQHAFWELIADGEALLRGERPFLYHCPAAWCAEARRALDALRQH